MMARPPTTATRREVLNGNSAYKSFVKAGGGEATLGVIAAAIAYYGGRVRSNSLNDIASLETSGDEIRGPSAVGAPVATVTPSRANGACNGCGELWR